MEDLLARHRKEKRDLQSRITQKKKNATKKTRKGVNDECERLERELEDTQKAEIEALQPAQPALVEDDMQNLTISDDAEPNTETISSQTDGLPSVSNPEEDTVRDPSEPTQARSKKPNRQKARLARRAAEQEAEIAAAAEEAAALPDRREQELSAMKKHMKDLNLEETLIRPDGHCLFSACAYGMPPEIVSTLGPKEQQYQKVRSAAAQFMASHPDDFSPFLDESLEAYVKKINDTAEWGGQLELQAIARSYNIDIKVLQADGRVETVPSDVDGEHDTIWLAYYRHSFGLGEHYNALRAVIKT